MTNPSVLTAADACMSERLSCSACCGIFNLKGSDADRRAWVAENTRQFLELDISVAVNIVQYRKDREAVTLPNRVRDDIYVCPFLGFVDTQNQKTGCLLHPQGSPHRQISLWPHPQNFSFYGEGICLSYDCLAKDRKAYTGDFFAWASTATLFAYARLASDHTLHRALGRFAGGGVSLQQFYTVVAHLYERHNVVTTSFEDIERVLPDSPEELCRFLAQRIDPSQVEEIAQELSAAYSACSSHS
ncbi:hypothetical protein Turpa_0506 [Turneriella parva DSM 21527]|uniref:Uncharacterized protein n=2 Tax=Turneriella TaxID=338321 RepID=I4B1K3_TURPD|nr:hypothetical protein Turpa_0506 [Turneriella parva DSM 21527]